MEKSMQVHTSIHQSLELTNGIVMGYLDDLTDDDLMLRAAPGVNHINWQLGHLIAADYSMVESMLPGKLPALPDGFAEKYSKEAATIDAADQFCTKAELLAMHEAQRPQILALLSATSDDEMDGETGTDYAPNVASLFNMLGTHWMMHAGQWVVVRRQLGREPMM